eukprot:3265551-Amphidinium_carterae.1
MSLLSYQLCMSFPGPSDKKWLFIASERVLPIQAATRGALDSNWREYLTTTTAVTQLTFTLAADQ